MSSPESSLPEAWTQRIFAVMRATYGAAFDRQWECPAGVNPEDHAAQMLGHWGRELSRFQQNPAAIQHGLDNLPEFPPNLPQFRAACIRAPERQQKLLPAPKADLSKVQAIVGRLGRKPFRDPKAWARQLRTREESGEKLSAYQRSCWREALEHEVVEEPTARFAQMPVEALPPAMQAHA